MFRFGTKAFAMIILIVVVFHFFNDPNEVWGTLLMLPGLILALTFHEYAHAKMADKLGDPTPEGQGRLTLNPFAHLDPIGTVCLLFAGFGWGKPVQINSSYFRDPAKDNMKVALAGPIMNFILAFVLFFVTALIMLLGVNLSEKVFETLVLIFSQAALLNVSLGVFNLLPVPPLDGSKVFAYFLKGKAREFLYTLERYSWIIILVLFVTDLPLIIIRPITSWITSGMLWLVGWIFHFFV